MGEWNKMCPDKAKEENKGHHQSLDLALVLLHGGSRTGVVRQKNVSRKKCGKEKKKERGKEKDSAKEIQGIDQFPFIFYITCKRCSGKARELSGNLLRPSSKYSALT